MTKRLAFIIFALANTPLAAQQQYSAAGCGLGSKLFEGQSGVGPHVLAATTNNFYGTQTFAMSSGTLGCDTSGTIVSHLALHLIDGDADRVAASIATGEGESIIALADAFGVQQADRQMFSDTLQDNFARIYPNTEVSSGEVFEAIINVMRDEPALSRYVS